MNSTRFLWTLWYTSALMLSTATELRLGGFPLGPGETLLALWAGVTVLALMVRGRVGRSRVARSVFFFWFASALLLLAGSIMASSMGVPGRGAGHDAMAFLFTAVVTLVYLGRPDAEVRTRYTLKMMVGLTVCVLAFLFVYGQFVSRTLGPVTLWYSNRFAGLSKNPNQLALLVCPIPFVALYFYQEARGALRKSWYLVIGASTLVIGAATRSDALMVSWLSGGGMAVCLIWLRTLRTVGRSHLRRAVVYLVLPLAVVGVGVLYGPSAYNRLVGMSNEVYEAQGQGSLRIVLYINGLRAMAASPAVGLGPGAHSGGGGPFEGSEAHNTFIDWGASTGVLGLCAYLALTVWLALQARRARQPVLLVAIAAALVYSVFHYVMRHPVFWFYLVSMALLARRSMAERAAGQLPAQSEPPPPPPLRHAPLRPVAGAFRQN